MLEIFSLLGRIAIENDEANKNIDETTQKAENAKKKQGKAFEDIGKSALKGAKVIATAGVAVGGALTAAVESTREYRVAMGKLETAFTTSGHSAETATSVYEELNSVLGDSDVAVEAANHLAKLTDNQQDLSTWTDICTGVFATFGDSLPIEGLTEAANETAKTGALTGVLADALNWAGVNEDKFQAKLDKCSTEQERQKLITSTLNDLYKESAETYRENNAEIIEAEKANNRLKEAMAKLGAAGEPVLNAIKNGIADIADKAMPKITELAEKFDDFGDWFEEHKTLIEVFAVSMGILTTAIALQSGVQAVKTAMNAAEATSLTALIAAKAADAAATMAMMAPYLLIAAAIAAVIAIGVLLVKNWDKIKETAGTMKDAVAQKWSALKDATSEKWTEIKDKISSSMSEAKEKVIIKTAELVVSFGAKLSDMGSIAKTKFESVKTSISSKMDAIKTTVQNGVQKFKDAFDFEWKLPKIKLPHFKISGEFSLNPPSIPSFGVEWYKNGGIMTEPTAFGINPATGRTMVGGEAGAEAIAPIETLKQYIKEAVNEAKPANEQNNIQNNFSFTSPKAINAKEAARLFKKQLVNMQLGY